MMVMSNGFETPCQSRAKLPPGQDHSFVIPGLWSFPKCQMVLTGGQNPRPKQWAHKVAVTLMLRCGVTFCLCCWVFLFPSVMTVVVVQSLSRAQLFVTPCPAACQVSLSFTIPWSLLKLMCWVSDAIQPSHPLLPSFPPALNLSQNQNLFQWVGSSHQVARVLELQLQHQSFQWTFRTDFL